MGIWLKVDQGAPAEQQIDEVCQVLEDGGVVIMPTDSVYGIGCVATPHNPAHERIFAIKQRARTQTLPWLVGDPSDLLLYGHDVSAWAMRLAEALWPGALTLVVRANENVGAEYVAADGTIALRVPDSELVRALARRLGPLATTSANTHGRAAATSGAGVEERIARAADLVLDAGPAPLALASTIVDCTQGRPAILREGAIPTHTIFTVASTRA